MRSIELTLKDGGTLHVNPYAVMHVVDSGDYKVGQFEGPPHCTVVLSGGERYEVKGTGEEIAAKLLAGAPTPTGTARGRDVETC